MIPLNRAVFEGGQVSLVARGSKFFSLLGGGNFILKYYVMCYLKLDGQLRIMLVNCAIMAVFWGEILEMLNKTSIVLFNYKIL